MPRFNNYMPRGVIPATLLAFNDDYSIDEASTRAHLRHVANVAGITAITVNGHASESMPVPMTSSSAFSMSRWTKSAMSCR